MKDNQIVKDYIEFFKNQSYNYEVKARSYSPYFYYKNILVEIYGSTSDIRLLIESGSDVEPSLLNSDNELNKCLYRHLSCIYHKSMKLVQVIDYKRTNQLKQYQSINKETTNEIIERIEEFDVIINDKIDEINLERLFDFYEVPFTKDIIKLIYN